MLELRAISKTWKPARGVFRSLLRDLDLQVAAGETVAVLGPSGSGKSTLLKIIAGLEAPDAGQVWLYGRDISALPPHRRQCGLLFQDFALFPHLNVQDNVAFGLIEQGLRSAQARNQANALLERFGIRAHALARPCARPCAPSFSSASPRPVWPWSGLPTTRRRREAWGRGVCACWRGRCRFCGEANAALVSKLERLG